MRKNTILKIAVMVGLLMVIVPQFFVATSHVLAQATPPTTNPPATTPPAGTAATAKDPVAPVTAALPGPLNCVLNVPTCAVYLVTYAGTSVASMGVMLGGWFMRLGLNLSTGIANSVTQPELIKVGFNSMLAIANLGFVLGLIVIAIATILRMESYGMKRLLLKLIFMAILVNFSMVFASTLLNTSEGVSNYFITKAVPGAVGSQGQIQFINAISGTFAPQALFSPPQPDAVFTQFSSFMKAVLNMIFVFGFLTLMSICLISFGVMFSIRYVYLGFLLILMPIAWLCSVFPNLQSHWSKWWNMFLKWTFFPPISIFFLYLALLTAQNTTYIHQHSNSDLYQAGVVNSAGSGLQEFLNDKGRQGSGIISTAGQMIIMLGLCFGGLFAANSLSITGAGVAMKSAKAAGKGFGSWAQKKGAGGMARYLTTPKKPLPPDASAIAKLRARISPKGVFAESDKQKKARFDAQLVAERSASHAKSLEEGTKDAKKTAVNAQIEAERVAAVRDKAIADNPKMTAAQRAVFVNAAHNADLNAKRMAEEARVKMLALEDAQALAAQHKAKIPAAKASGFGGILTDYAKKTEKAPGLFKSVFWEGAVKGTGLFGSSHDPKLSDDQKKTIAHSLGLHGDHDEEHKEGGGHDKHEGGGHDEKTHDAPHGGGGAAAHH
jgi:hypothetical protein